MKRLLLFILALSWIVLSFGQEETGEKDKIDLIPKAQAIPISQLSAESEKVLLQIRTDFKPKIKANVNYRNAKEIDSLQIELEKVKTFNEYSL